MLKNFFLHDLYFPCIKCHRYFPFSYLVLFTHVLCWQCVWQLNMEPHSLSSIPFDVTDMLTRVQTRIRSNTFKEPCNTQCNISEANDPHTLQQQQQFFNNITLLCVLVIFFHPLFWAGSGWRELAKSCLVGFSRARNCSWNTFQKTLTDKSSVSNSGQHLVDTVSNWNHFSCCCSSSAAAVCFYISSLERLKELTCTSYNSFPSIGFQLLLCGLTGASGIFSMLL